MAEVDADGDLPLQPLQDPLQGMVELEVGLVRAFGWSLRDIDETEVESLMEFIGALVALNAKGETVSRPNRKSLVYCDEVSWL